MVFLTEIRQNVYYRMFSQTALMWLSIKVFYVVIAILHSHWTTKTKCDSKQVYRLTLLLYLSGWLNDLILSILILKLSCIAKIQDLCSCNYCAAVTRITSN
jgi:hypothetical protein